MVFDSRLHRHLVPPAVWRAAIFPTFRQSPIGKSRNATWKLLGNNVNFKLLPNRSVEHTYRSMSANNSIRDDTRSTREWEWSESHVQMSNVSPTQHIQHIRITPTNERNKRGSSVRKIDAARAVIELVYIINSCSRGEERISLWFYFFVSSTYFSHSSVCFTLRLNSLSGEIFIFHFSFCGMRLLVARTSQFSPHFFSSLLSKALFVSSYTHPLAYYTSSLYLYCV